MTQTLEPRLVIPPVPRPASPRAARRSWGEARVQGWWKLALLVLLITAFVAYNQAGEAIKQRRLAEKGVLVDAKAVKVMGVTEKDNPRYGGIRDQSIPVELETILPDGRIATLTGYLPPGEGWIKVNQELKVRVDPNDLTNWAEVGDILPWWRVFTIPLFLMLPVALVLLGLAWWRRQRVLRTWSQGLRARAVVVGLRHSATAPLSRIIRFTLAEGEDRRVFIALFPNKAGIPAKGDAFTLIYPYGRPDHGIVAELYVEDAARDGAG
ncbi:MAG: hypothetical protein ABIP55_15205 [Tepidisphaeraceae bacterium]